MIQIALNGKGEPRPTLMQSATQAVTIELFTQWQTYANGVHMDWDTFRSIDFRALAAAALTGAGFSVTAGEVTPRGDHLDDDLHITVRPVHHGTLYRSPGVTKVTEEWGEPVHQPGFVGKTHFPEPGTLDWEAKHDQVQS